MIIWRLDVEPGASDRSVCTYAFDAVSPQFSILGGERLFHFAASASDRLAGVQALSSQHAIGGGID